MDPDDPSSSLQSCHVGGERRHERSQRHHGADATSPQRLWWLVRMMHVCCAVPSSRPS
jgi:hypothetical protein